jgi:transposase
MPTLIDSLIVSLDLDPSGFNQQQQKALQQLRQFKSTAEAIGYALNLWHGLTPLLDDGRIEIDSNCVERSMRPIALSRKNSLFAGSNEGAENWAAMASLIETCKLNGVDPQRYFTELLTRLVNGWPQARIDELMPWHWAEPNSS